MTDSASRLAAIAPSPTLAVSALARELKTKGRDILDLSAGEPDFDTPAHVRKAACAAIERGDTHYTEVDGTPQLKRAIAEKFARENGLEYSHLEIIASCGAKQVLFNLALALLDPGDEVVIPAPYWVSYPAMAQIAEAIPVIVDCPAANGFKLDAATLAGSLTQKTRLVILNSPNNPSGAVYTRNELSALAEVLVGWPEVAIATDDIYEHLVYEDDGFSNLVMAAPELKGRTVIVNGVSKAYAMTGWRLGYAAGPAPFVAAMRKLQSQSTSNPSSISQAAAVAALDGDQGCVAAMRDTFKARRDRFVPALAALPGIRCALPAGAFYAFADCRGAIAALGLADDVALANRLIEKTGVASVPGSAFGVPGHLRFSYATDRQTLDAAVERLGQLLG